jgi:glycosyltransferase involved in cell wall biosynthesis
MGGIGRAALELVRALAARPAGHRITMIVGAGYGCDLASENLSIVTVDAAMIDERFEQLHLPSLLEEIAPDLYLNTSFSVPAIKTTKAQVAIIHDVVFEDHPEYVEPGLRAYLSRWARFAASHADHVITVSDHARERIQCLYGAEPSKVTRIYNGIPSSSFVSPEERDVAQVRSRFDLQGPFILYLGTIEIKKGIVELLKAFRRASDSGFGGTLVLAGGKGGPEFDLERQIKIEGCEGRVRSLGFVDEAAKKPLMKACSLFVYPSLYEGFGIPPLEAMALGVPCVVSDLTSLPEIVGEAALIAKVQEPVEFANVLIRAIGDADFRRAAAVAGPARAREFTCERLATQVLELCKLLVAA